MNQVITLEKSLFLKIVEASKSACVPALSAKSNQKSSNRTSCTCFTTTHGPVILEFKTTHRPSSFAISARMMGVDLDFRFSSTKKQM